MSFVPEKPYNELPTLPPKGEVETRDVLKQCIKARCSLTELNTAGKLIPNQKILINTLPLLEAKDSSAIENIVTTSDQLFQCMGPDHYQNADPATKEVMRYRSALYHGFYSLKKRPITTVMAEELCSQIKDKEMSIRKIPGTKLANSNTGEVVYTPPVGESLLREKLTNWEIFLNEESELDPLIKMALLHYQFEAIHPFTDGNGRTGRILNILYLVQEGLLDLPILYLSRYIMAHKKDYYQRLIEITRNKDWEQWILYKSL